MRAAYVVRPVATALALALVAGCSSTNPETDTLTTATELGVFGPRGAGGGGDPLLGGDLGADGAGAGGGGGSYIDPDGNIVSVDGSGQPVGGGGFFGDDGFTGGVGAGAGAGAGNGELYVGPDGVIREILPDGSVVADNTANGSLGLGDYDTNFGSTGDDYLASFGGDAGLGGDGGDRVFFATDRSDLSATARETLRQQAIWLQANPGEGVLIEGHCDERGTREYNLALGARRAEAARAYLVSLGIDRGRIQTVSYGKERPEATCSSESCWSQNRRAVIVRAPLRS